MGVSNALEALTSAKTTFFSRSAFYQYPRARQELQKDMEILEKDLNYLLEKLKAASSGISERQKMVIEKPCIVSIWIVQNTN